jgi:Rrf2 family protein
MLKISRKADYALLLLSTIAQNGNKRVMSLREVSKAQRMPYKYLSQIAPILVSSKILGSKEGVGGGYFLIKDPNEIKVSEVLRLFDGPVAPVYCMSKDCICASFCAHKGAMQLIAKSIESSIGKYRLSDLVNAGGK